LGAPDERRKAQGAHTILRRCSGHEATASLYDRIARQPSLVTKERQLLPLVVQRTHIADGVAWNLERLALGRVVRDAGNLAASRAEHQTPGGLPIRGLGKKSAPGGIGSTWTSPC
jgi:hypothetical protein